MVYSPDIQILHKEKSSTRSMNTTSKEMKLFYYLNMCKLLKVFLALTNNYKQGLLFNVRLRKILL